MSALILVEHDNHSIHPSTFSVLAAAKKLSDAPVLLVVGSECHEVAQEAASLNGVDSVLYVDNSVYKHHMAENISELIVELSTSYSTILSGSTTFGKNIMPRVAALLDVAQVTDVSKIIDEKTFEHPIYAGNAIETVEVQDQQMVLTIRATAFEPDTQKQEPCNIEQIDKGIPNSSSSFVSQSLSESSRPELTSADVIVSGGRGLQSADKFELVEQLADALGAAVGASRAAVDAGFVPNDYQVGQTGKVVAPSLYIALGISGAVQHLAGMKDSKVIVAINKDEDAPIFQVADYGLVGDLFELVPQLIEKIRQHP